MCCLYGVRSVFSGPRAGLSAGADALHEGRLITWAVRHRTVEAGSPRSAVHNTAATSGDLFGGLFMDQSKRRVTWASCPLGQEAYGRAGIKNSPWFDV